MGIRWREERGGYEVTYKDRGGKRRRALIRDKQDAEQFELEADLARLKGEEVPAPPAEGLARRRPAVPIHNFEAAIEETWNIRWSKSKSGESQYDRAKSAVSIIGAGRHVKTISSGDLARMRDHLIAKGLTGSTANRYLSAVTVVLKTARELEWTDSVPTARWAKEGPARERYISEDEEQAILHWSMANQDIDFAGLVIFLVDSGCRAGEAEGLSWDMIDFEEGCVRLPASLTKTSKGRTVYLTKRALSVLEDSRRRLATKLAGPFVVVGKFKNRLNRWNKMKEDIGLEGDNEFVPHCLRHTCASRLVQRGVSISKVAAHLGHTTIQTTQRYAHLAGHHVKDDVLNALDDTLRDIPEPEEAIA